jgi:hypothetical protein
MYAKSRYSVSRFFTPPTIEPLDLDLKELRGGGYAPAQFEGHTPDGRHVYCRYRGGGLSVTVAKKAGEHSLGDGTCILDVRLGPPLHGGLTLGQLCHYAGITINGERPPLPTSEEMRKEGAKNLSGASTFFDVWVNSTHQTQRDFLQRLLRDFPECTIVQPRLTEKFQTVGGDVCRSVDEIKQDRFAVLCGNSRDPELISGWSNDTQLDALFPETLIIDVHGSGFKHPIHKYSNNTAEWVRKALGLDIQIAGQCDELLHGSFSLHASFPKEDSKKHRFLEKVSALLDNAYPAFRLQEFDVVTGAGVSGIDHVGHFDPAIAAWIAGAENRWYFVLQKREDDKVTAIGQKLIPVAPPAVSSTLAD